MTTYQEQFNTACDYGDIQNYDELAFRWSCKYGHFEIAKWLIRMGVIPSRDNREMYQYFIQHTKRTIIQHSQNTKKLNMVWCYCSKIDIR